MKKMGSIVILVLFILTLCSSAFAWAPRMQGQPDAFDPGGSRGYFIWHDGNGLHMWTTTKGARHQFSGEIRTDGRFVDVHGRRLESDDWYKVGPERHVIKFDFTTEGGADGVNFAIEGGDRVTFDLFIDGHKINPNEIHIGDHSWHPERSEFTLYR
ncbi:MAG: hypothetical protein P4N59_04045 [Negativicutes bacterium]|nr:hypothetical protein [Negativicutes bacterium]